jgi:hypothetical protein
LQLEAATKGEKKANKPKVKMSSEVEVKRENDDVKRNNDDDDDDDEDDDDVDDVDDDDDDDDESSEKMPRGAQTARERTLKVCCVEQLM